MTHFLPFLRVYSANSMARSNCPASTSWFPAHLGNRRWIGRHPWNNQIQPEPGVCAVCFQAVRICGLGAIDQVINPRMSQYCHYQCRCQHGGIQIANSPTPNVHLDIAIDCREGRRKALQAESVRLRVQFDECYRNQPKQLRPVVHGICEHLENLWQDDLWRAAFR